MMPSTYESVLQELRRKPRRWLITGVAGFIGSNLLEKLLQLDQHVVGIDNFSTGFASNLENVQQSIHPERWARFQFHQGDITSEADCQRVCRGIDYVLHQAALGSVPRSIENPLATHVANVSGFLQMLNAARQAGVSRLVYASSSSVYGDHPGLPKVEDQLGTVLSPYAASKYANEIYADAFFRAYEFSAIGLRYFNVFGPRQAPEGAYAAVIPRWIGNLIRGKPCRIFGDGDTSRDFTYVENAIQANLLAATVANTPSVRVFNVACGDRLTLTDLYRAIETTLAELLPGFSAAPPVYESFRRGDVRHSLADIQRAAEHLGYQPTHFVAEGLKQTVRWFLEQRKSVEAIEIRRAS